MAKVLPFTEQATRRPQLSRTRRAQVVAINLAPNNPLQELVLLGFAALRADKAKSRPGGDR